MDGIEIVASLVLLADRRAGRRPGWLPWTALAAGTIGSLAANVAAAQPDPVSRVIAGWPALALLVAVRLLASILERHPADDHLASAHQPTPLPGTPDAGQDRPHRRIPARTHPGLPGGDMQALSGRPTQSNMKPSDPDPLPDVAALLPAARQARDELRREGLAVTRDALASHLRRHGHPIRSANVSPLLRQLRHEQHSDTNHRPTGLAA